jgi:hypothetical protein
MTVPAIATAALRRGVPRAQGDMDQRHGGRGPARPGTAGRATSAACRGVARAATRRASSLVLRRPAPGPAAAGWPPASSPGHRTESPAGAEQGDQARGSRPLRRQGPCQCATGEISGLGIHAGPGKSGPPGRGRLGGRTSLSE